MKISNETKIGALTLITIVLLFLGFNFLKGKNLFKSGFFLNATFPNAKGLQPSNPVIINGYQVGTVYELKAADNNIGAINIEIKLNEAFNIPKNSVAVIESNPLGTGKINIKLGNGTSYFASGEQIQTQDDPGMLGALTSKLGPTADNLASALSHMDTLLINLNTVLNDGNKGSIAGILANMQKMTAQFAVASASLNTMLDQKNGALAKTMNNVESITGNLASNNAKINNSVSNLEKTTAQLSETDIKGISAKLNDAMVQLNTAMTNLNGQLSGTKGTAGALLNDRALYNNINNTVQSLNTLMDDLRVHPKRYVNISIFGKKDKKNYLTEPLKADSLKAANAQ
jgi:phospholipid/cholesterol/gamma-HCH transport system substrate-binding protein